MSYFDNINPYDIIDGPWGGMGIATWFNDFDPENPKDVYELDWVVDSDYSETEENGRIGIVGFMIIRKRFGSLLIILITKNISFLKKKENLLIRLFYLESIELFQN